MDGWQKQMRKLSQKRMRTEEDGSRWYGFIFVSTILPKDFIASCISFSDEIRLKCQMELDLAHRQVIFCVIYDNDSIWLQRQSFLLNEANQNIEIRYRTVSSQ